MIDELKDLITRYVRDASSVEVWVDEGKVDQEWPSLYLKELIVINIVNMTKPYPAILGAIRHWYEENHGGLSDSELEKGMEFDVSILKENDAFMQVRLQVRERYLMKENDEGLIDASLCR